MLKILPPHSMNGLGILEHYNENGIRNWQSDKEILLDLLLHADDEVIFNRIIDLLEDEKKNVINYESLDLQAMAHFRLNNKIEAYRLIPIIKKLALEQRVNYQSSLHLLNN